MQGTSFHPARLTVTANTTIVWRNLSDLQHTVTAYEQSLPEGAVYFATGDAQDEEAARQSLADGLILRTEASRSR